MRGNELWNLVSECRGAGLLTNCPVPALQGLLLSAAGSASVSDGLPRQHAKFDSPQWTYSGRSYGLGASIGLPGWTDAEQHSLRVISYADYGYKAAVTCSYNDSAAYSLQLLTDASLGPTSIAVYMAGGVLPNSFNDGVGDGAGEAYSVASSSSDYLDILAWSARAIGGQSYISIASGTGKYMAFNKTQCEITFTASAFNITVNITSKAIEVSPTGIATGANGLLPNLTITTNAINSLNLLSRMSGTLYSSILGDALTRNLATIVGDSATVGNDRSVTALNALQDSFTAMLDDILVAYGAAQVSLANDTKGVPAVGRGPLIAIGDALYIYIVLGMSSALLLYHLFNTVRVRFWTQLQAFDPFDAKSLIAAASSGGSGIARNLEGRSAATDSGSTHRVWNGRADDKLLRAAHVTFRAPDGEHRLPSIVSASEGLIDWIADEATYLGVTSRHTLTLISSCRTREQDSSAWSP